MPAIPFNENNYQNTIQEGECLLQFVMAQKNATNDGWVVRVSNCMGNQKCKKPPKPLSSQANGSYLKVACSTPGPGTLEPDSNTIQPPPP